MKKKDEAIEFRYYAIPAEEYVLSKLGPAWEMEYGTYAKSIGHPGMLHFHNLLEVGYCYRGHGKVVISGQEYRYDDEEIFTFIPKNIAHTTSSDPGQIDKWEFLFIDMEGFVRTEMRGLALPPDEILRIIGRSGFVKKKEEDLPGALAVRGIIEESRAQQPYRREAIKGFLRALVMDAVRIASEEEQKVGISRHAMFVERALEYLDAHYMESDFRMKDAADWCNVSESYFRSLFIKAVGMNPNTYLNMTRINRACDLLLSTDESVEKIGELVGYQTTSTLIRNFRALTGSTPLQWKKEMQEERLGERNFRINALRGWEGQETEKSHSTKTK